MQSRTNFATTTLVVLWMVTGGLFGGLVLVDLAPTPLAVHALDRVPSETVTVRSPASAHG
jgi:hypothetical protein